MKSRSSGDGGKWLDAKRKQSKIRELYTYATSQMVVRCNDATVIDAIVWRARGG